MLAMQPSLPACADRHGLSPGWPQHPAAPPGRPAWGRRASPGARASCAALRPAGRALPPGAPSAAPHALGLPVALHQEGAAAWLDSLDIRLVQFSGLCIFTPYTKYVGFLVSGAVLGRATSSRVYASAAKGYIKAAARLLDAGARAGPAAARAALRHRARAALLLRRQLPPQRVLACCALARPVGPRQLPTPARVRCTASSAHACSYQLGCSSCAASGGLHCGMDEQQA